MYTLLYLYFLVLVVCSHVRAQIVILKKSRIISRLQICFMEISIAHSQFSNNESSFVR